MCCKVKHCQISEHRKGIVDTIDELWKGRGGKVACYDVDCASRQEIETTCLPVKSRGHNQPIVYIDLFLLNLFTRHTFATNYRHICGSVGNSLRISLEKQIMRLSQLTNRKFKGQESLIII